MHFQGEHIRCWRHRIATFSLCEIGITFTAVATATAHFFFGDVEQIAPLQVGLFLGIISIATAPAAMLLVIREYNSAGPITDVVRTLIGLNKLVCMLLFNVAVFSLLSPSHTQNSALAASLLLPPAIGAVAGFAMSVWAGRLRSTSEHQLLILGGAIGVTALCDLLAINAMLGTFTCGAILANHRPVTEIYWRLSASWTIHCMCCFSL